MNLAAELPRNENQPAATPQPNTLRLNNRISSMGAEQLSSHRTNALPATVVAIAPDNVNPDVQPRRSPLPTTSKKPKRARPDRIAPPQSNRCLSVGSSGFERGSINMEIKIVTMPTGTLAKNTARQSKALTNKPPMAGPAMAPAPTTLR